MPPANRDYLLGIDLGGTRIKAVAITPGGVELARESMASGSDQWKSAIVDCVTTLISRLGPPLATGVAAPGLPAPDGRSIKSMPDRLPGLEGLDWTNFLQLPTPVPVLNDAHAALLGEVWLGAAVGISDAILLTLGTGVGGAILSNGRLLRGHIGRAGHFGHISINSEGPLDMVHTPGSLEDAVGNHSLSARSGGRYTCSGDLVADVATGDPTAVLLWKKTVRDLAAGVASLINVLDPQLVLIGGGIAEAGESLFTPLAEELARVEWRPGGHRVTIAPTRLGDWAGAFGAARVAQIDPPDPS